MASEVPHWFLENTLVNPPDAANNDGSPLKQSHQIVEFDDGMRIVASTVPPTDKTKVVRDYLTSVGIPADCLDVYSHTLIQGGFDSELILQKHLDESALEACGITKLGHVRALLSSQHNSPVMRNDHYSRAIAAAPAPPSSSERIRKRSHKRSTSKAPPYPSTPSPEPAPPPRKRIAVHAASFAEARGDLLPAPEMDEGPASAWRNKPGIKDAIARTFERATSGQFVDEATGRPLLLKIFMSQRGDARFRSVRQSGVHKPGSVQMYEARLKGTLIGRPSIGQFESELLAALVCSLLPFDPYIQSLMSGDENNVHVLIEEAADAYLHPERASSTPTLAWVELIPGPPWARAVDPSETRIY